MRVARYTLVNALRVAAEQYAADALVDPSLADQFRQQQREAVDMAERIEESDKLFLHD